ncbi:unnamed protein product, partial [Medioppia subpectinata]
MYYCTKECQKNDCKYHKNECKLYSDGHELSRKLMSDNWFRLCLRLYFSVQNIPTFATKSTDCLTDRISVSMRPHVSADQTIADRHYALKHCSIVCECDKCVHHLDRWFRHWLRLYLSVQNISTFATKKYRLFDGSDVSLNEPQLSAQQLLTRAPGIGSSTGAQPVGAGNAIAKRGQDMSAGHLIADWGPTECWPGIHTPCAKKQFINTAENVSVVMLETGKCLANFSPNGVLTLRAVLSPSECVMGGSPGPGLPEYQSSLENLQNQFNRFTKTISREELNEIFNDIDNRLTVEEIELQNETKDNIPNDVRQLRKWRDIGLELGRQPLFKAMCANCGQLLFGDCKENGRWTTVRVEPNQTPPVCARYEQLNNGIPYTRSENEWYLCKICKRDPRGVLEMFDVLNPETNTMTLPPELSELKGWLELSSVALMGTYHTIANKPNPKGRRFQHHLGETEMMSKKDNAYLTLFTLMQQKLSQTIDESDENYNNKSARKHRVKRALHWLKEWNPLFQKFYSNYETLMPYIEKNQNPFLLSKVPNPTTTTGEPLNKNMGDEQVGTWIAAENYTGDHDPDDEEDFPVGITHPKVIDEKTLSEREIRNLTRPGLNHTNLEALAYPRDYPSGKGSFNPDGKHKHREYCKCCLLNYEPRWRQNEFFIHFQLNRYVKQSLKAHNRIVITNVKTAVEKPTAGDLKKGQSMYDKYGERVPANIPGSQSYWWAALQELHSISVAMGREPDYFATVTTNDNWPEIQFVLRHGPGGEPCDRCPHDDEYGEPAIHILTRPGLNHTNLEALAYPRDYPSGKGSFNPDGKHKHREYCKYVKQSLKAHNRIVITNVKTAVEKPTAGELKKGQSMYDKYGERVPANIPGLQSYWWAALQELHSIKGELGKVVRYWYRREYQWRGGGHIHCAIWVEPETKKEDVVKAEIPRGGPLREYQWRGGGHIHCAIWVEPETKKEDVVKAEIPRGGPDKELQEELEMLVKRHQIHTCRADKCFVVGRKKKKVKNCRFGFPYRYCEKTMPQEGNLRKLYRRRCKEDQRVVPYSYGLLLTMRAHVNIQEVQGAGWELYLAKYMTKPEPVKKVMWGKNVSKDASDVERFLKMRLIGSVEANDHMLQFPAKSSNIEVIYLPIELPGDIERLVLKRNKDLPSDPNSEDHKNLKKLVKTMTVRILKKVKNL